MVNAKNTKNEFKTIEQQINYIQKDIEDINDAIDEYNLHLEYLGDLLSTLETLLRNSVAHYYKGAVGFAMDHVIQQRDELMEKQTKLLREHKRLCRKNGLSSLY